ncbi:conserved hypothetical protein [Synechococcus sp. PCC 7335]|uniref:DUF262 domain-containing protein n=1 Tax=Synechococcus sp. (strain ATCC 29403 / PCC 7335) TaxID=91464 RepID=UPI00017EE3F6|nr:DUF262 domain-containing protein [Synechococcus sp. PCC 7335]EDX86497.1 conserved hypothetical protein [Synechococcus sp. PCC 7335]
MPVAIHATEKPLFKIFSDDFFFSIPPYQRPYAWTIEQASELLTDVLAFLEGSSCSVSDVNPYFLGSIVLIKSDDPKADVVDGQQRLTTLTILLSVLRKLDKSGLNLENYLYQPENIVAQIPARYRLKLREKDERFFRDYIQEEFGLENLLQLDSAQISDSQQRIQENARYFLEVLRPLDEAKRLRLTQYLMTRCFLVVVSTPDLDSAYRIFSVLNARGLNLSLADLLKSEIIGAIPNHQQERYTRIWDSEEEDLGREAFQEMFSHIRMIHRKAKLRETALNEFRKYILPNIKPPERFIDDILKPYSDALETIKKANYQGGQETEAVDACLRWLNMIDNFDWIPPGILYISRYKSHSPERLERFFVDLERLAAGLMILRANINTRINRYAELLTSIENDSDLYEDDSPLQLTSAEMTEIADTLNGDLYLMTRIRKYVLLRLDSALAAGTATYQYPIITIEHVLPQNPKENSQWMEWFEGEEREQYVHKIGNLTLLSRRKNAQAQNDDFDQKKERYFSSSAGGANSFVLTTQVLQKTTWTPETIEQRQRESVETLKCLWRL